MEPTAMQLATCVDKLPSLRTVLLKKVNEEGLTFFTDFRSRKGKELAENPHAALLFLWKENERQVIIEGTVQKASRDEAEAYFNKRPRESRLAASVSHQDEVLSSKEPLIEKFESLKKSLEDQDIPLPDYWGGYRLIPNRFEFWQGGAFRLHDRFQYLLKDEGWLIDRLSP